jgi:hypothetical protein
MDQVDLVDVFLVKAWELSRDSSSVTLFYGAEETRCT